MRVNAESRNLCGRQIVGVNAARDDADPLSAEVHAARPAEVRDDPVVRPRAGREHSVNRDAPAGRENLVEAAGDAQAAVAVAFLGFACAPQRSDVGERTLR